MLSVLQTFGRLVLGALALSLSMCSKSGTETDNPLVDFDASECKSGAALVLGSDVMRTDTGISLDPAEYDGLYCYAWQARASGALTVDILNYSSGCGASWVPGQATVQDDELTLVARNGMCAFAACGGCNYDFTFEVQGVNTSRPLDLVFQEDDCQTIETAEVLTLPLDERSEGVVCRQKARFVHGLSIICGGSHLAPCLPAGEGTDDCDAGSCGDESLQCVEGICLEMCERDDDCLLDVDHCQDGLCRLRETF